MAMNKVLDNKWVQGLLGLTTALYGIIVYWLLFIRNRSRMMFPGEHRHLFDWQFPYANLQPFRTIRQYVFHPDHYNFNTWAEVFVGNLILFVPFGILAPLVSRRMRSFPRFFLVLFLILLALELAQKWTMTGTFDVDDIILNMAGGLAGFALVRIVLHWTGAPR